MRITSVLAFLTALVAATAPATGAASTDSFRAEFHEAGLCPPGVDICGDGVVHGFGQAATTLTFTSLAPGPGDDCVSGTADRDIVLDADGSRLHLEISGTICKQKIAGTYEVGGGTGVFAGATGGGVVRGIAIRGTPSSNVHVVGTLTLP